MYISITNHAKERIKTRFEGLLSVAELKRELISRREQIASASQQGGEVRVIVRSYGITLETIDGSRGDLLVACLHRGVVSTVMLQRSEQKDGSDVTYIE